MKSTCIHDSHKLFSITDDKYNLNFYRILINYLNKNKNIDPQNDKPAT